MDRPADAWAGSGAMWLTGRAEGAPLGAPAPLVALVERATQVLADRSVGQVRVDGLALLGERAALSGLGRHGRISCGGGTRLVRAADGWLAVSLARPDDVAALPAWLEADVAGADVTGADVWERVEQLVLGRGASDLDARAALLGLPIAAMGSVAAPETSAFGWPIGASSFGAAPGSSAVRDLLVVDLSALWAGPLAGQLLAEAGARVVKVESLSRPDGARRGPTAFFDLLNGDKEAVALDLASSGGRDQLRRLLSAADVVIESSRPRALEQMDLVAADLLGRSVGPRVWLSITSHGGGRGERVGFGDVAAAAGGLVVFDADQACFVADAVTDPLTGLVGAAAVLDAVASGGRWLLRAGMAQVAAAVAGEPLRVDGLEAARPQARRVGKAGPVLGADTATVLAQFAGSG